MMYICIHAHDNINLILQSIVYLGLARVANVFICVYVILIFDSIDSYKKNERKLLNLLVAL